MGHRRSRVDRFIYRQGLANGYQAQHHGNRKKRWACWGYFHHLCRWPAHAVAWLVVKKEAVIFSLGKNAGVGTPLRSTKRAQSPLFRMAEFQHAPLVSFCISHKNRLHQLKETLPKNLDDNRLDQSKIEFVLVDFESKEDVGEWLMANYPAELATGYLKYFQCTGLDKWHSPRAKNTAHRVSSGKILVNLDGDNFTGYRGGMHVYNAFMSSPYDVCLWQYSGDSQDGSFGRIAVSRDAFFALGGYNEEFLEMGFQDRDLVNRLEMIGAQVILDMDARYNQAIVNEKYVPPGMKYEVMRRYNRKLAGRLIRTDNLVANAGKMGLNSVQQLMVKKGNTLEYVAI